MAMKTNFTQSQLDALSAAVAQGDGAYLCESDTVAVGFHPQRKRRILEPQYAHGSRSQVPGVADHAKPYSGGFGNSQGTRLSENEWPEPKPLLDGLLPVAKFDPAFLPESIALVTRRSNNPSLKRPAYRDRANRPACRLVAYPCLRPEPVRGLPLAIG
jgi:hypothetical protein